MKLTIEIPDAHTGSVLEFVAALIAKTSTVEAPADPAPGHPELSLDDMIDAAQAKADKLVAKLDALISADPLKVAMDDPVEDTRQPIPPETGKTYLTRHGVAMTIVEEYEAETDDFEGQCRSGTMYYRRDGRTRVNHHIGNDWDLVSVISNTTNQ